ncbi:MAG: hypothetical protein JWO30_1050 [Fibrobacteres bacterium]|nr:hypothetical protein [Fibrobacterota bacterium]
MGKKDPRIDAIIAKSADFAKPILTHIRKLVHQGCPEAEETLKWGMPHFLYGGEILCGMAPFKAHAVFGFWKGSLIVPAGKGVKAGTEPRASKNGKSEAKAEPGMGQFGKLTSVKDLPNDKTMLGYIKTAMTLNDQGVKSPTRGKNAKPKPPVEAPAYFLAALKKNKAALATYQGFSPSQKREYVEWITEAKTDATRDSRLATAVEWMAEGKVRLWKYQR